MQGVAGPYVSGHLVLDYFFGTDLMGLHNFVGWMAVLATIINVLPVSFSILLVVRPGSLLASQAHGGKA